MIHRTLGSGTVESAESGRSFIGFVAFFGSGAR
jgi:hypothetical protein